MSIWTIRVANHESNTGDNSSVDAHNNGIGIKTCCGDDCYSCCLNKLIFGGFKYKNKDGDITEDPWTPGEHWDPRPPVPGESGGGGGPTTGGGTPKPVPPLTPEEIEKHKKLKEELLKDYWKKHWFAKFLFELNYEV